MNINKIFAKKGYITLEAAIIIPLFLSLILTFASFLQIFLVYNCMKKSLDNVSYFFSSYAMLYHENGCRIAENYISAELSDVLLNIIDINTGLQYADDLVYQQVAKEVFQHYLQKDKFYNLAYAKIIEVSFVGSTFFNGNDDLLLNVSGKVNIILPLFEKFLSGFIINTSQKSRAWLNGDMTHFTIENDEEGNNVWGLNNFDRGNKIRELFGGNLPECFPVISSFSNGTATMIKSLDHTAESYGSSYNMRNELNQMADKLYDFSSAKYDSSGVNISIEREDINKKVILLVMPTNEFTLDQQFVINEFMMYCNQKNIKFDLRRYQNSYCY